MGVYDIVCPPCGGTGTNLKTQASCVPCGGTGTLDLLDKAFLQQEIVGMMNTTGYSIWAIVYAGLIDTMDKLNDLTDKVNDIMEKCNEIKAVVDAL